jgi:hypothetical protein
MEGREIHRSCDGRKIINNFMYRNNYYTLCIKNYIFLWWNLWGLKLYEWSVYRDWPDVRLRRPAPGAIRRPAQHSGSRRRRPVARMWSSQKRMDHGSPARRCSCWPMQGPSRGLDGGHGPVNGSATEDMAACVYHSFWLLHLFISNFAFGFAKLGTSFEDFISSK